jgi:hypothetical protein
VAKVPVVIREDYTMLLELHNNLIWFHTDVRKWTPTVKAKYLEDLNLLQHLVSVPLYALSEVSNKKLIKFGKSVDFKHYTDLDVGGKPYTIYFRSIKHG